MDKEDVNTSTIPPSQADATTPADPDLDPNASSEPPASSEQPASSGVRAAWRAKKLEALRANPISAKELKKDSKEKRMISQLNDVAYDAMVKRAKAKLAQLKGAKEAEASKKAEEAKAAKAAKDISGYGGGYLLDIDVGEG